MKFLVSLLFVCSLSAAAVETDNLKVVAVQVHDDCSLFLRNDGVIIKQVHGTQQEEIFFTPERSHFYNTPYSYHSFAFSSNKTNGLVARTIKQKDNPIEELCVVSDRFGGKRDVVRYVHERRGKQVAVAINNAGQGVTHDEDKVTTFFEKSWDVVELDAVALYALDGEGQRLAVIMKGKRKISLIGANEQDFIAGSYLLPASIRQVTAMQLSCRRNLLALACREDACMSVCLVDLVSRAWKRIVQYPTV